MPHASRPKWWERRRILWPLAAMVTLTGSLVVAVLRSGASYVVVYNNTGRPIGEMTITACGQEGRFKDVADSESVRFTLTPQGSKSDIAVATNGAALWRGEYIEPAGGFHAFVHLRRDGQVDAATSTSWWQGFLTSDAASAEP